MGLRTLDENWVLGEALMPLTVASSPVEPGTDTRPNIMVLLARLQIGHLETQHKAFDNLVKVMQEGDIVKTAMDAADIVENNNESMEGEIEAPDDENEFARAFNDKSGSGNSAHCFATSSSHTDISPRSIKAVFDKNFPSLETELDRGRVTSPRLSMVVQNLPIDNSSLIGSKGM